MCMGGRRDLITAASGAIPRSDNKRQKAHAKLFYEEVRHKTSDVASISENTNFSIDDIQKVKEHIFFNEYLLGSDVPERFDPDYDMAVSWQRLTEGKAIQEMDLVLLDHELMEYKLMKEKGLSYSKAHAAAHEVYNYKKFVDELDRRAGK